MEYKEDFDFAFYCLRRKSSPETSSLHLQLRFNVRKVTIRFRYNYNTQSFDRELGVGIYMDGFDLATFDLSDRGIADTMIHGYDVLLNIHDHLRTLTSYEKVREYLDAETEALADFARNSTIDISNPERTVLTLRPTQNTKSSRNSNL